MKSSSQRLMSLIVCSFLLSACPKKGETTDNTDTEASASSSELQPCTRMGQTDCITTASFPSAQAKGDSSVLDLNDSSFPDLIKSEGSFQFWDSKGRRHEVQGSSLLRPEHIKQGIHIFGITGTLNAAKLLCAYADKSSCEADNACEWAAGVCRLDPWNLRVSKTIAGTTGQLKTSCRNRIIATVYNSDSMPPNNGATTAGVNMDWWDTMGDDNLGSLYPTSLVSGWTTATDCDRSVWRDLTADGACDSASDDCIMQDRITGLIWSESYPVSGAAASNTLRDWSQAVAHCDGLSFAGFNDWRLATQKELQAAYVHGINGIGYINGTSRVDGSLDNNSDFISSVAVRFWSATSSSTDTSWAWYVNLVSADIYPQDKTTATNVICVRP